MDWDRLIGPWKPAKELWWFSWMHNLFREFNKSNDFGWNILAQEAGKKTPSWSRQSSVYMFAKFHPYFSPLSFWWRDVIDLSFLPTSFICHPSRSTQLPPSPPRHLWYNHISIIHEVLWPQGPWSLFYVFFALRVLTGPPGTWWDLIPSPSLNLPGMGRGWLTSPFITGEDGGETYNC